MISFCRGFVLHHSDVVGQIVVAVTVPLNFLIWLRGCFIPYIANNVWPCNPEGFFNLPWWYFYHRCLWCFYNVQGICFMFPSDNDDWNIQNSGAPKLVKKLRASFNNRSGWTTKGSTWWQQDNFNQWSEGRSPCSFETMVIIFLLWSCHCAHIKIWIRVWPACSSQGSSWFIYKWSRTLALRMRWFTVETKWQWNFFFTRWLAPIIYAVKTGCDPAGSWERLSLSPKSLQSTLIISPRRCDESTLSVLGAALSGPGWLRMSSLLIHYLEAGSGDTPDISRSVVNVSEKPGTTPSGFLYFIMSLKT